MKRRKNWAFEIIFIVAALIVGVGFSLKPWQAFMNEKKVRDEFVAEMNKAEKESEDLARKKARAESPLGREELARQNNFARPGEAPIEPK